MLSRQVPPALREPVQKINTSLLYAFIENDEAGLTEGLWIPTDQACNRGQRVLAQQLKADLLGDGHGGKGLQLRCKHNWQHTDDFLH